MKDIEISVIVPVYNAERYIKECLDSICHQTFKNFELILIDDGSTDESGRICDEYAALDSRINVIHKQNEGVSIARNVGIELSKGQYIIFVDSDDWLDDDFFDILFSQDNDADILFYGNKYHYENNNIVAHIPHAVTCTNKEDIEKEILHLKWNRENYEYYGYTWDKVFKSKIIKSYNIRFVPFLSLREDELFTSEYCRHIQSLSVIPVPIYNYRVLNTGLTHKNRNYNEINKYRKLLLSQIEYWSTKDLKKYEIIRYARFLNSEAVLEKNFFSCIHKTVKAYSIIQNNLDERYCKMMGIMQKMPVAIGVILNLYKNLKK